MANHNGRTEQDDARTYAEQQYRNFNTDSDNLEHGYQDPRDQPAHRLARDDLRAAHEPNPTGNDRGQSGAQAGDRGAGAYRGPASRGGSDGQWGDFDRGGRYARGSDDRASSMQAPRPQHAPRASQSPSFEVSSEQQRWSAERTRGPHAGKGPKGYVRSDERILELVHEVLTDHEHVDASNITVGIKDGEVTLTGHVDRRSAKLQAEDLASTVSGVKDVHNRLRIGSPSSVDNTPGTPAANRSS
jgi:osmotically-inducible protein OsmY